jgi:hypothetical protein
MDRRRVAPLRVLPLTPPTRRHGRLDRAMAIRALSVATVVIRGVRLHGHMVAALGVLTGASIGESPAWGVDGRRAVQRWPP